MQIRELTKNAVPVGRAQHVGRLLLLCALVGFFVGGAAVLFELLTTVAKYTLLNSYAGFRPSEAAVDRGLWAPGMEAFHPWRLAFLPVIGGLVGGLIIYYFAPEAEGHGTDAAIDAYHNHHGRIRYRVPLVKTITSVITLGTAGSAGREGPIAQIGAGLGTATADLLKLSARNRRILMVAGMAAGIGAIFRAPLAGALFAAEVLYKEMDLEFEVIVPAVIASIISYTVFTIPFGVSPLFKAHIQAFDDPLQLFSYTILAIVVAMGAKLYVVTFYAVHDFFRGWKIIPYLKPAIGGLGVGLFAFFLPEVMGSGYGVVQQALDGRVPWTFLGVVVLGKITTTSLTIGSGQSGGVFGPAIVIGAALSGLTGQLVQHYIPWHDAPAGAFVIVGMAGFFAAAANTPISTIIMVSEMVGSYDLLVPTMWVTIIAFLLVRRSTIYRAQVASRSKSLCI
ncbi:MAG: chloride channel protein [Myxococcales bacterium]|nr:MAG: chloride channel protein [Myxococcales bacterium]